MEVRNDAAYRALMQYCEEALGWLRKAVEQGEDLPRTWKETFRFSESGWAGGGAQVVDWAALAARHVEVVNALPSYGRAVRALESDESFAARDAWKEQPEQTVSSLFGRLLEEQGDLAFNGEAFDRVYGETEDYYYRETVEYRYVAPLKRFRMEADEIQLDAALSIVRIPEAWSQQMLADAEVLPPVWDPYVKVAAARYGLVQYVELQKETQMDPYRIRTGEVAMSIVAGSSGAVCTALRLFKRGAVGYEYVVPRPTSWVPLSTRTLRGGGPRGHLGEAYELSKQDGEDFVRFWHSYRKAASAMMREWKLAVRRFNLGYERAAKEDRLVDYMIGFEALLLKSEGELRYRLALRAAALLGRNANERESIADELRAAYRQRNRIVHGGAAEAKPGIGKRKRKKQVRFDELVERVEDHLRRAIRKCVERWSGQSKGQMIHELERRIVRGLGHRRRT